MNTPVWTHCRQTWGPFANVWDKESTESTVGEVCGAALKEEVSVLKCKVEHATDCLFKDAQVQDALKDFTKCKFKEASGKNDNCANEKSTFDDAVKGCLTDACSS